MKKMVFAALLIGILGLSAIALAEELPSSGATSGTYQAGPTNKVTIKVTGKESMGDYEVTYTHNGVSIGPYVATPHPNGGVDAAPEVWFDEDGDGEVDKGYRVKYGKVQWSKPNNPNWSAMRKESGTAS